jgi:hypothetical protein
MRKISLDEDNSRCSYNQEGAGLNITNLPPEPADPPCVLTMSLYSAVEVLPLPSGKSTMVVIKDVGLNVGLKQTGITVTPVKH